MSERTTDAPPDAGRLECGEIARCDECRRARPIDTAVIEVLGARIGFGPGGESDMFVERDGTVRCYRCVDEAAAEVVPDDHPQPGDML